MEHPSAALVIRVWLENGSGGFRARVTALRDSSGKEESVPVTLAVTSSPGDVIDAVRAWLQEFTAGTGIPIDSD